MTVYAILCYAVINKVKKSHISATLFTIERAGCECKNSVKIVI